MFRQAFACLGHTNHNKAAHTAYEETVKKKMLLCGKLLFYCSSFENEYISMPEAQIVQ